MVQAMKVKSCTDANCHHHPKFEWSYSVSKKVSANFFFYQVHTQKTEALIISYKYMPSPKKHSVSSPINGTSMSQVCKV